MGKLTLKPGAIAIITLAPFLGGQVVALLFVAGIGALTMRAWQGFLETEARPAPA